MSQLRLTTAGESHGPGLTTIVEGLPAGLQLDQDLLNADMARRQLGHGRGGRMKIEKDSAEVTAGVRHGRTMGGPIALWVVNRDYQNWEDRMNPWPVEAEIKEVHLPRPGHADLVGVWKFGHTDVRNVLERASARETAARVAGGALAKAFLRAVGVEVVSHVTQIAGVRAPEREELTLADFAGVDESPVRCLDAERAQERLGQRPAGDAGGGLSRARALVDVGDVGEAVLPHAGEVGVAGAREVDLRDRVLHRPRVHPLLPVGVVAVGDLERHRAAQRAAVADAGGDLRGVLLDLHPPATAVAELAAGHVAVDGGEVELQARGQALDDAGQARSV
jgi:hypothetical protein